MLRRCRVTDETFVPKASSSEQKTSKQLMIAAHALLFDVGKAKFGEDFLSYNLEKWQNGSKSSRLLSLSRRYPSSWCACCLMAGKETLLEVLRGARILLDGGHINVQQALMAYFRSVVTEDFFPVLRQARAQYACG